ncbi:VQ motif [Musa troglodytarum]|uniref:VQ motif n=2 Tax=Musa troglodytarum TaxID=320322 RepID=A0A9E7JLW9_9LILI|nr:VQ motif [Musa troglodytarum]
MPTLGRLLHPSMAMGDTVSGPAQWAQLGGGARRHPSATPAASDSNPTVDGLPAKVTHQQIEGRVGKPVRRRSRATRRAPTTMLNTDTTNFRAMVQQFTGVPSGPYSAEYRPGGVPISNLGGGYSSHEPLNQTAFTSFGHLQQHQYQGQSLQHPQEEQQQYQSSDGNIFTAAGGAYRSNNSTDALLLQGFNNSSTALEVGDDFFFDGTYSHMMPRPTSTGHRAHGYFS